jgi:hypothetical protein
MGPSLKRDPGAVGKFRCLCTRVHRPAIRRGPSGSSAETLASALGHKSSDPQPQTVRVAVESTAAGTHHSNWHPDRCQHTFWRLCRGNRVKSYQIGPQWPNSPQKILIIHIRSTHHHKRGGDQSRRSKSSDHKNIGQNNSCTSPCRYGGQFCY